MLGDRKRALGLEEYSSMILFSGTTCPGSHRIRFVLAEKDVAFNLVTVPNLRRPPEDLLAINPRGDVPTLADRDLVLYNERIISEYLDERFPHPPLMPVEPMPRARLRLALHHVEEYWNPRLKRVLSAGSSTANRARKELKDNLIAHIDMFGMKRFFISDEFSLVDCAVAPLLWRLPGIGIELPPKQARIIARYHEQVFTRPGFIRSLTKEERGMRLD